MGALLHSVLYIRLNRNRPQGFAYGLLDTLKKHFQLTLGITRTRSSGLQAAYFGAYPLASLGYGNWVLRNYGYRAVFIMGASLCIIDASLSYLVMQVCSSKASARC